jgi:hypothetical protein
MHQTCLAHLLRRCREIILVAGAGAREFPCSVQEILAASTPTTRPSRSRPSRRAGSDSGPRTTGSAAGSYVATSLSHAPEPTVGQPSVTRARCPVYFPETVLVWRPRTGERNRPSVPWSSRARYGAGTALPEEHARKASWSAFCRPCRLQLRPVSSFLQKLICSPQPEVLDLTSISLNHGLAEVATNCPTAD